LKAPCIEVPKLLRHAHISRSDFDDSRRFSPPLWAHDHLDHRLEIAAQPIELLGEDVVGLAVRKALKGYPRPLGRIILLRLADRGGLRDTEGRADGVLLRVLRVAAAESEKKDGEERSKKHPRD
jgi:hypothetical protein